MVSYLIGRGVNDSRLTFEGRGELEPIATNKTEEGRSLNRRVEFAITANEKMIRDARRETIN